MLEIINLTKYYGKVLGVKNLNLKVEKGEIFGFVGPNGAGKSTTIRCIMSLINTTSGDILIDNKMIDKDNYLIKEEIGYLPSEIHLYDDMKVKEIFNYSQSFYTKDCKKKIKYLVDKLDINENKKIEDLSLGNLKKVGIVLAMMHEPKLLILDEPTSGLDPLMQEVFYELMQEEKNKGTTIFLSSHNLFEIKKICDKVGIIKKGNLIKVEKINDLLKQELNIITIKSKDILKIEQELKSKCLNKDNDTIKLFVDKDINLIIKILNKYNIDKLLIEEPSIEDILMHYYK